MTIDEDSTLVAYIHNLIQGSSINEIVDPAILAEDGEGGACLQPKLQAVVDLALTCTEEDPQRRPNIVDVSPNNSGGLRGSFHYPLLIFYLSSCNHMS